MINERQNLLESIAQTTSDYRLGEIEAMTPEHVNTWISQFQDDVQVPLLRELDHVLKRTYFSKKRVIDFLEGLITTDKLAGSDPCDFWKRAHFLNIQQGGNSQNELLAIFDDILEVKCGFKTAKCGASGDNFIYLDDAMFSGDRLIEDLKAWITKDAPAQAVIHVVVIAIHTMGLYWAKKRLKETIDSSGKKIDIHYWRAMEVENHKINKNYSEVLWPAVLPDDHDLKAYLDLPHKYPFVARSVINKLGPFSSEQGRQLLERELLLAGVKIRAANPDLREFWRPLGKGWFGLGFGSMIVTFRNCPNTCPLALWWGDPTFRKFCPPTTLEPNQLQQELNMLNIMWI